jgi:hypothetical protein
MSQEYFAPNVPLRGRIAWFLATPFMAALMAIGWITRTRFAISTCDWNEMTIAERAVQVRAKNFQMMQFITALDSDVHALPHANDDGSRPLSEHGVQALAKEAEIARSVLSHFGLPFASRIQPFPFEADSNTSKES